MNKIKMAVPGGFVKGFDPRRNRKGRAKVGETFAEKVRDALAEEIRPGYSKLDALIDEALERAKAGDYQFFDSLMSRAFGKVPDRVEQVADAGLDLSRLTDEELAELTFLQEKATRLPQ